MFWDVNNERDERKKKFIETMKIRKCHEFLDPLSDKLLAWDQGEITPEEVINAAGYAGKKGSIIISDFKKRPDVILAGIAMDENRYLTSIGDTGISVRLSNVTEVFSDAIIYPASMDGSMTTGTALVIRKNAGDEVEEELRASLKKDHRGAIVTSPGELAVRNIIHVLPCSQNEVTGEQLTESIAEALRMAEELDSETLAISGFFTGLSGLDKTACALAVLNALRAHQGEIIQKVILTDPDEDTVQAWEDILEKMDEEE